MNLRVNGEPKEIQEESTIAALLAELGAPKEGVAVAVNGDVVPRSLHASTPLRPGDRVEVIRAVGGG